LLCTWRRASNNCLIIYLQTEATNDQQRGPVRITEELGKNLVLFINIDNKIKQNIDNPIFLVIIPSFLLRKSNNSGEIIKQLSIFTQLKNKKYEGAGFKNIMHFNCNTEESNSILRGSQND